MEFCRFSLRNGIRAIVVPMPLTSPVVLQVWCLCGMRIEEDHQVGLAHCNEHMFFRGGRDFPDSRAVDRELRLLGECSNAYTADEFVLYFILTSSHSLERAMHLLSDMLIHAKMRQEDLDKERGAIIREIEHVFDDPDEFLSDEFSKLVFGNHPLGRTELQALPLISRFTVEDVRGYKDRFYGPPNMVISVAGGQEVHRTKELLEEYFGAIPIKAKGEWIPFTHDSPGEPAKVIKEKKFKQAYLRVGGIAPSYLSDDVITLQVLREILGSRLWFRIRVDEGLAYDIGCETRLFADIGMFSIFTRVSSDRKNIERVLELIFKEMQSIRDGGVGEAECEESKMAFRAKFDLDLASVASVGSFFGLGEILRGTAKSVTEVHREIDAVTKERVAQCAQMIWREEAVRALLLVRGFSRFEKMYCKLRSALR